MGSTIGVSVLAPAWVRTRIFEMERYGQGSTADGEIAKRVLPVMKALAERGRLTADDVAAIAVDGIKENRFYIFPHQGILQFIGQRHDDIAQMRNPSVQQGL